ncbi:MAG: transposase [Rickettsiales bacterium]|nr:transposase [Rickettsiales bacterium]
MKKLRQGKYKVKNWNEYNKSLKKRGDITFWLSDDALGNWLKQGLVIKPRGRQVKYSNIALQTIYTFRGPVANKGVRRSRVNLFYQWFSK